MIRDESVLILDIWAAPYREPSSCGPRPSSVSSLTARFRNLQEHALPGLSEPFQPFQF